MTKCKYCKSRDGVVDNGYWICCNCGATRTDPCIFEDSYSVTTWECPRSESVKLQTLQGNVQALAEKMGVDVQPVLPHLPSVKPHQEMETAVVYVLSFLNRRPVFMSDFEHSVKIKHFRESVKQLAKLNQEKGLFAWPTMEQKIELLTDRLLQEYNMTAYRPVLQTVWAMWTKEQRRAEIVAATLVCHIAVAFSIPLVLSRIGERLGVSSSSITNLSKRFLSVEILRQIEPNLNNKWRILLNPRPIAVRSTHGEICGSKVK